MSQTPPIQTETTGNCIHYNGQNWIIWENKTKHKNKTKYKKKTEKNELSMWN